METEIKEKRQKTEQEVMIECYKLLMVDDYVRNEILGIKKGD